MCEALLRYVYGVEPPTDDVLEKDAWKVLNVADRFGCVNLKLLAESTLVETGINESTAAEMLLLFYRKELCFVEGSNSELY